MSLRNIILWAAILIILSPFMAFAAGNYIPQFDSYTVTSGSMEPEIKTGSVLFTIKTPAERIDIGDTITYRDGDHFTTHKVISKNTSDGEISFRTKGVANNSPDPGEVTEEELQGKKLFSIPLMGYFLAWAGTTTGLIALIVLPSLILLFLEAKRAFHTSSDRDQIPRKREQEQI